MLDQLLNDFKNELSLVNPSLVELFNPPVSHKMLLDAEREIGRPLPEALKKLYLIHDGQADGPGLFFDWTILSLKQLVKEWQDWDQIEDFYEATFAVDSISVPRGCIQERYSCQNWIPIGKDFAGNNYAVDMEPDSLGIRGQIIVFGRDYDFKYVLATSLEEFIAYLTAQLKSGQYQVEDEQCITIEPPQYKQALEIQRQGVCQRRLLKDCLGNRSTHLGKNRFQ